MNTENNKLIAEFLGYKLTPCNNGMAWEYTLLNKSSDDILNMHGKLLDKNSNYFKFHSSWDWLMPVVEKIESLKVDNLSFNFEIQKDVVTLCYTHTRTPEEQTDMYFEWGQKTKIGNVYEIVVKFIKWYNQQNK